MIRDEIKEQLINRLDRLSPETKGLWGRMTVVQMLAHMCDAMRICLGMKEAKDLSTFLSRTFAFPMAVYLLPSFPKNLPTAPEQNTEVAGSKPRDFYIELETLKKLIDIFNEREEAKLKPHPYFGKLSKTQWRDLFLKHFDHHLKQFGV